MPDHDSRPASWTPARGAAALVAEFGEDGALELLARLLVGGVGPTEFGREPWARVIAHIGSYTPAAASAAVSGDATPLDLTSPANAYWPRSWAARALAYVGDERAAPCLVKGLADRHWRVRMTASQTIGRLRMRGLEAELLPLLQDAHPRVRAAAKLALERTAVAG